MTISKMYGTAVISFLVKSGGNVSHFPEKASIVRVLKRFLQLSF